MAKRKKKVLWIGGGVVLGLIILIVLVLLFGSKALKPRIEATASSALGMDVRVQGGVSVSLFPVFGASLSGITVKNAGADVATMASVKIGLKFLPLIRGRVEITGLELVKPVISIVRQKNGKLNIEAKTQGGRPSGNPVTVRKLAISHGSLHYTDLESGGRIELDGVDITAGGLSAGGTGDLLKSLSFTDDIRCRTIRAGNLTLTDLVMRVTGRNGVFDVSHARMSQFGGTGSGTLHADFTGTEPHFRATFTLSRLKIEELLQEPANAKNTEGFADFSADLTAMGKSALELKRSLSGQVSLNGENIRVNNVDIDGLISALERSQHFNLVDVGGYFLAGPWLGMALTRGYKFADLYKESLGGKAVIVKLVSVWRVGNGVAEAVDVAMTTKKQRIAMKGGLNFVNERFEEVIVAVLDKRGCAVYSQKIHGPFSRPEIGTISTLRSFTSPLTNLLRSAKKLIEPGHCAVFYTGSVAAPERDKLP